MYHNATSTDHIDLLHQVRQLVTSRNLTAVAINAAGTGYAVDDILTVAGGTSTHSATLRVKTVGGSGEITAIVVDNAGAYSVDPTTTANAATGGTGSSATFDLTMSAPSWSVLARSQTATGVTLNAPGAGYTLNDILTIVGGTRHRDSTGSDTDLPTVRVTGVTAGQITSIAVEDAGHLLYAPTSQVLLSGGTGSGAAATFTWGDVTSNEQGLALQGTAAGSTDAPIVLLQAYEDLDRLNVNPVYNWSVGSCTDYDTAQALWQQTNYKGCIGSSGVGSIGPVMTLKDADIYDIEFWLQWTGRHLLCVAKVRSGSTTRYPSFLAGHLNPFQSGVEQPYPFIMLASTHYHYSRWDDLNPQLGGVGAPVGVSGSFLWDGGSGSWKACYSHSVATTNAFNDGNNSNTAVWPGVEKDQGDNVSTDSNQTGFSYVDMMKQTGSWKLMRTPDTSGDIFPLFRRYALSADSGSAGYQLYGELPGHFWFHTAEELISSEDILKQNGSRYLVFQSGDRVDRFAFFAMEVE